MISDYLLQQLIHTYPHKVCFPVKALNSIILPVFTLHLLLQSITSSAQLLDIIYIKIL